MLFNTLGYALFLAVVFVVSWSLVRAQKWRLLFLLGASYFFYAHWDFRFLPLIWGSSTADYFLARAIHRAPTPAARKRWLISTVVMNLGVLGFFKYWNFGIENVAAALGIDASNVTLRVALPVGISFFTFESMSYVIDVYRRELEPAWSYTEYLSFVAFFPHLVAGPIVRPRDLLPQLAGPARFDATLASEGLFLIAVGLAKKIVIGDYLALNLIDRVFDAPAFYSALEVYAAVVGYALQIYCDFSGYTDIAIGSALILGVRFPVNFDSPYQAVNIADFWRRWHISLSTCCATTSTFRSAAIAKGASVLTRTCSPRWCWVVCGTALPGRSSLGERSTGWPWRSIACGASCSSPWVDAPSSVPRCPCSSPFTSFAPPGCSFALRVSNAPNSSSCKSAV